MTTAEASLIEEGYRLFASCSRPQHFTNHTHCCECAEHDETLNCYDRDNISREALGNGGWDPVTFTTEAGFKYYFPALVRVALTATGDDYYLDQFLFHLNYKGDENRFWLAFNKEQRDFTHNVLLHLLDSRAEEIEVNMNSDDLMTAIALWSSAGA